MKEKECGCVALGRLIRKTIIITKIKFQCDKYLSINNATTPMKFITKYDTVQLSDVIHPNVFPTILAYRRKNALQDSHVRTPKLKPSARSPHTRHSLSSRDLGRLMRPGPVRTAPVTESASLVPAMEKRRSESISGSGLSSSLSEGSPLERVSIWAPGSPPTMKPREEMPGSAPSDPPVPCDVVERRCPNTNGNCDVWGVPASLECWSEVVVDGSRCSTFNGEWNCAVAVSNGSE